MKHFNSYIHLFAFLICISFISFDLSQLHAQPRNAGQMVVPKGWEVEDSVYLATVDHEAPYNESDTRVQNFLDTLGVTMTFSYGGIPGSRPSYGAKRKGYIAWGHESEIGFDFTSSSNKLKQRIYFPSPERLGIVFDGGYRWRYIDTLHYTWLNNTFDANDISPYAEFGRDDSLVASKYYSKMYNTSGDSLSIGAEGRLILGYNDMRNADWLLSTMRYNVFIDSSAPSAKAFSARFDLNIKTDSIDMTNFALSADSVPLIRLQILYKRGEILTDPGSSVLPFVPYKSKTDTTQIGWYKLIDTTLTQAHYDLLSPSWRAEDTLTNGTPAHSWQFKQWNVMLKDLPWFVLQNISTVNDSLRKSYGSGSALSRITSIIHPDSTVRSDSTNEFYRDGETFLSSKPLFEIRLLSTYRAKIRLRSMTWQDTIIDKFLYRARFGDTTHSLNPDGTYGGLDDSLQGRVNAFASRLQLSGTIIRNVLFNDVPDEFSANSGSGIGYMDYMLSKRNIHTLIREQEYDGDWSRAVRRERMSYDAEPSSVFENQVSNFYSQKYKNGFREANILDVFPGDYLPFDSLANGTAWPNSPIDTMQGMIIGRIGDGSDPTKAYRAYTETEEFQGIIKALRSSAYAALHHPNNKKHALQASPSLWGEILHAGVKIGDFDWVFPHDTVKDKGGNVTKISSYATSAYKFRPITPEEAHAFFFSALANGASAFSVTQYVHSGGPEASAGGPFGISMRDSTHPDALLHHDYNFGHRRTKWSPSHAWLSPNHNVVDSVLPAYYLGFSNHYRAAVRISNRLHNIYDTLGGNKYPLKRMQWIDAYSTHNSLSASTNKSDTSQYNAAFIKAFCTTPVKRWERGAKNEYIDSLVADSAHRTYVEVGLFRDNPGDTLKGFGAMVVNTRLWPSLRDAEDSIYYNQGLPVQDQSRSLFGDIATRKVWLKLDTNNFPPPFRTQYYTVRDVWHQDTTYLVKHDSNFAIYLKPGEARLLYIEKGIAIKAAKSAEATSFCFNNGRRIAERNGNLRTAITYIRNGNLCVSYPAKGGEFEGYNERSAGDNIATGWEVVIDSGDLYTPSISVDQYDTSLAIAYFSKDSGNYGRIKFAYQHHPDSAWRIDTYMGSRFADFSSDGSDVTPVLTPYANNSWVVAASYSGTPKGLPGNPGILGFRANSTAGFPIIFPDATPQYLYSDQLTDTGDNRSKFPTLSSRSVNNSMYPIRMAWQKAGQIYYRRLKWISPLVLDADKIISRGLPSFCYNMHPSIGTGGYSVRAYRYLFFFKTLISTASYLSDNVVWESKLYAPNSKGQYWPVLRPSVQLVNNVPVTWGQFIIMRPDSQSTGFHYPVVTSEHKTNDRFLMLSPQQTNSLPYVGEGIRVGWQNENLGTLEFVHLRQRFLKTELAEPGAFASLPIGTGTLPGATLDPYVLKSLSYLDTGNTSVEQDVRVTNGWFPYIAKPKSIRSQQSFVIYRDSSGYGYCPNISIKDKKDDKIIHMIAGPDTTEELSWLELSPTDYGDFGESWAVPEPKPLSIRTESFVAHPNDSIVVPRSLDTIDVTGVQSMLQNSSDYLIYRIHMYRSSDSAYIMTLDSGAVTTTSVLMPGYGLDPYASRTKLAGGFSTDTVFLAHQFIRTTTNNILGRIYVVDNTDTSTFGGSYKRIADEQNPISTDRIPLTINIFPNPLSLLATVIVSTGSETVALVELYDINGKRVATLFNGLSSGKLTLTLDGKDLTNGIYFLRTQCGNSVVTKKVELIK